MSIASRVRPPTSGSARRQQRDFPRQLIKACRTSERVALTEVASGGAEQFYLLLVLDHTMGYDRYPEMLIDEKSKLLNGLLPQHGRLFFTHDPEIAMGTVARDDKGKYRVVDELVELRDLAS
jgi:hypothetical protein